MKKTFKTLILILSIFTISLFFTSMSRNKENDLATVTGTIRYQGNAPFEYPCIRTSDNKIYTISADQKTIDKIRKNSTAVFEFKGNIIPNEKGKLSYNGSKDGYFEVESFKIISSFEDVEEVK